MPFYNGVPTHAELQELLKARGQLIYRGRQITLAADVPSNAEILRDNRMPADTPVPPAGVTGSWPVPQPSAPQSDGGTTLHNDVFTLPAEVPSSFVLTYLPRGYVSMYQNGLHVPPVRFNVTGNIVGPSEELRADLRPDDEIQIVYQREV